jgi:hypothetical protein
MTLDLGRDIETMPEAVALGPPMNALLPAIPVVDIREGGPPRHARHSAMQARALRDACLGFFPPAMLPLVPVLDRLSRRSLARSRSPYLAEIAQIAAALDVSGVWLLNASYHWGCTARASEHDGVPWLIRTLDWPFIGLGRHTELAHMRGACGDFISGHLARLCRRAHGDGAAALRGRSQPGTDAAADPASLASPLRLRGECLERAVARRPHSAGSAFAPGVRAL